MTNIIQSEEVTAPLATALRLLHADAPTQIMGAPEGWQRWEVLLSHVLATTGHADGTHEKFGQDEVTDLSWLLDRAAAYLQVRARFSDARPLQERALAIAEAAYGPDHPAVASNLNNLAQILWSLGRAAEARPLQERALAIAEAAYGPDHPDVATRLNNLAVILQSMGRAAEARPLQERALAAAEAAYGSDHPVVATNLNNLAMILRDVGCAAEARPLQERALTIAEAAYGPDHPEVATNLNNLAQLLRCLNRAEEARLLQERALAIDDATMQNLIEKSHIATERAEAGSARYEGRPKEQLTANEIGAPGAAPVTAGNVSADRQDTTQRAPLSAGTTHAVASGFSDNSIAAAIKIDADAISVPDPIVGTVPAKLDMTADAAVTKLYSNHYRSLVRLAALLVRDESTAEEVVQDCFVAMHGGWDRLRDEERALSYLKQAVVNRSRSVLRHRSVVDPKARKPTPDMPSAEQGAITLLEHSEVISALQALPDRQRQVLVLRYYADLSEAQIAEMMDISKGAVKSYIARGMSALRAVLEQTT